MQDNVIMFHLDFLFPSVLVPVFQAYSGIVAKIKTRKGSSYFLLGLSKWGNVKKIHNHTFNWSSSIHDSQQRLIVSAKTSILPVIHLSSYILYIHIHAWTTFPRNNFENLLNNTYLCSKHKCKILSRVLLFRTKDTKYIKVPTLKNITFYFSFKLLFQLLPWDSGEWTETETT